MDTRRSRPSSKKPAARDDQRVVRDAGAWVASLRSEVASMLEGFRRQHMERASARDREVLDHVAGWVKSLRLDVAELLPELRTTRLKDAKQDGGAREDFVRSVAEWVEDVSSATRDQLARTRRDIESLGDEHAQERRAMSEDLAKWGDDFKSQIHGLLETLREERRQRAEEQRETAREYVERLRREVAEMRAGFRGEPKPPRRIAPVRRMTPKAVAPVAAKAPAAPAPDTTFKPTSAPTSAPTPKPAPTPAPEAAPVEPAPPRWTKPVLEVTPAAEPPARVPAPLKRGPVRSAADRRAQRAARRPDRS